MSFSTGILGHLLSSYMISHSRELPKGTRVGNSLLQGRSDPSFRGEFRAEERLNLLLKMPRGMSVKLCAATLAIAGKFTLHHSTKSIKLCPKIDEKEAGPAPGGREVHWLFLQN